MNISGFEPLTLIDYPGKIAAIVFTPGCALRCPFCHNPELIEARDATDPYFRHNREDEFFSFLKKRRGKLDGVVITGGEPTLHAGLIDFMRRVKDMGFLVKLDTNGIFPDKVEAFARSGLVDYFAMDIKHAPKKYHLASGRDDLSVDRFERSFRTIMESGIPYELRTTVVPGIHTEEDFPAIGQWIHGATNYALQAFRDIKIYRNDLRGTARQATVPDLNRIAELLQPHVGTVRIRS